MSSSLTPARSVSSLIPARMAALASWTSFTSDRLMATGRPCPVWEAGAISNQGLTFSGCTLGCDRSIAPVSETISALRSAATASRMPDPHRPTGRAWLIVSQRSSPSRQIRRSMAPSAARIPSRMCAPSKAGPEAVEQLHIWPCALRVTSVLVPMSRLRVMPGWSAVAVASSIAM